MTDKPITAHNKSFMRVSVENEKLKAQLAIANKKIKIFEDTQVAALMVRNDELTAQLAEARELLEAGWCKKPLSAQAWGRYKDFLNRTQTTIGGDDDR